MSINLNKTGLLLWSVTLLCVLSSCMPGCGWHTSIAFKNCTSDTLFIGASQYDSFDSVDCQLLPYYLGIDYPELDTIGVSLWENREILHDDMTVSIKFWKNCYVYPDSSCVMNAKYLFEKSDTCYFFLVRWRDARQYSWDEIHAEKLYRRWVTIKNKDGDCDRNIQIRSQGQNLSL